MVVLAGLSVRGVQAGDLRPVLNLTSKHIGTKDDYNEQNYGAGIEYHIKRKRWYGMAGGYRNSEDSASWYMGVGHRGLKLGTRHLKLGLEVGAVTGYDRAEVLPLAVPVLRVVDHLKVLYIPKYGRSPHVIGLQMIF